MSTIRQINSELGHIPAKTIADMKANTTLINGDIVLVGEGSTPYKIQTTGTELQLDNGLYAKALLMKAGAGLEVEGSVKADTIETRDITMTETATFMGTMIAKSTIQAEQGIVTPSLDISEYISLNGELDTTNAYVTNSLTSAGKTTLADTEVTGNITSTSTGHSFGGLGVGSGGVNINDNGSLNINGSAGGRILLGSTTEKDKIVMGVNASGEVYLRDTVRGADLIRFSNSGSAVMSDQVRINTNVNRPPIHSVNQAPYTTTTETPLLATFSVTANARRIDFSLSNAIDQNADFMIVDQAKSVQLIRMNPNRVYCPNNLQVIGTIISNSNVTAYSDIRLKENLKPVENALNIVDELNVYHYDWKKSGKHDIGVIAQEVQKVLPELVIEHKEEGEEEPILTVDYGKLSTISLKAVKELKEQNESLRNDLQLLLKRIEKLEGGR